MRRAVGEHQSVRCPGVRAAHSDSVRRVGAQLPALEERVKPVVLVHRLVGVRVVTGEALVHVAVAHDVLGRD